jgi:hypothetical protein
MPEPNPMFPGIESLSPEMAQQMGAMFKQLQDENQKAEEEFRNTSNEQNSKIKQAQDALLEGMMFDAKSKQAPQLPPEVEEINKKLIANPLLIPIVEKTIDAITSRIATAVNKEVSSFEKAFNPETEIELEE